MSNLKTMMLLTVPFSQTEKSFRIIPVHKDCPFLDVVYWKDKKVLEVVAPHKKQEYNMFAKLNDNGDPEERKSPAKGADGKPMKYKQERKITEVQMNYYITEKEDMIAFIDMIAINADTYDYKKYLNETDIIMPAQPEVVVETPTIIMP